MALPSPVTRLFEIDHPVFCAPMDSVMLSFGDPSPGRADETAAEIVSQLVDGAVVALDTARGRR